MIIKKLFKCLLSYFAKFLITIFSSTNSGRFFIEKINSSILEKKKFIKHKDLTFNFYTPNRLTFYRVKTFSDKEPKTLEWIDRFEKDCTFWDIGANIGLYSCYAAKRANANVYSFEPSVFNIEILSKTIFINSLTKKITIVFFPLSEGLNIKNFYVSNKDYGGALANFGDETLLNDTKREKNVFNYKTLGISADESINILKLKKPDYLKLDVDGIENLILKGSSLLLKNVKSLLVEVDESDKKNLETIYYYLKNSGLKLIEKNPAVLNTKSKKFKSYFNQIWGR